MPPASKEKEKPGGDGPGRRCVQPQPTSSRPRVPGSMPGRNPALCSPPEAAPERAHCAGSRRFWWRKCAPNGPPCKERACGATPCLFSPPPGYKTRRKLGAFSWRIRPFYGLFAAKIRLRRIFFPAGHASGGLAGRTRVHAAPTKGTHPGSMFWEWRACGSLSQSWVSVSWVPFTTASARQ